MKKLIASALLGLGVTACGGTSVPQVNGAGATFPAPLYTAWFHELAENGLYEVNYQAIGSGAGIRSFNDNVVDFGATDAAIPDDKIVEDVVQIPMTGGAIVPAYNNAGCKVRMTQRDLARVFLGQIDNWNYFGCGSKPIIVVYRSDGSGTTKGFTASLSAFSEEWAEEIGSGKAVEWRTGIGAKGNSGVAAQIAQQDGAIGYLNYGYVGEDHEIFQQVELQNKSGEFVTACSKTTAAGLAGITLDDKMRGSNPNPEGEEAYPIVSLTWILARPVHPANDEMKEIFTFMLSSGAQQQAVDLGYAFLPDEIRRPALEAIGGLKTE